MESYRKFNNINFYYKTFKKKFLWILIIDPYGIFLVA